MKDGQIIFTVYAKEDQKNQIWVYNTITNKAIKLFEESKDEVMFFVYDPTRFKNKLFFGANINLKREFFYIDLNTKKLKNNSCKIKIK